MYVIEKAGPFINKNQLNKTTKCLYLAVGRFFYVRISHIPPRAIGAHISLPAARPPRDRPSPIEPHFARSARISPAVWHISPLHSPARFSAHISTPHGTSATQRTIDNREGKGWRLEIDIERYRVRCERLRLRSAGQRKVRRFKKSLPLLKISQTARTYLRAVRVYRSFSLPF